MQVPLAQADGLAAKGHTVLFTYKHVPCEQVNCELALQSLVVVHGEYKFPVDEDEAKLIKGTDTDKQKPMTKI